MLPAFPIGVVSGGLGSVVGIGGALVMVPTAGWAYGLKQLQANSTALLPNVATCASGAWVFASNGCVDPIAGVLVAAAATATAGPGARLAHRLTERTRKTMFAVALLVMGPIIAVKPYLASGPGEDEDSGREETSGVPTEGGSTAAAEGGEDGARGGDATSTSTWRVQMPSPARCAYYLGLGASVGAASGILGRGSLPNISARVVPTRSLRRVGAFCDAWYRTPGDHQGKRKMFCGGTFVRGIGAGTMMSVGLALAGGMPHKTMLGTSFAAQIGPGLSGAWAHYRLGNLRVDLVPALVCGSAIGSAAAASAAVELPEEHLRLLFSAFVVGLGLHAMRAARRVK